MFRQIKTDWFTAELKLLVLISAIICMPGCVSSWITGTEEEIILDDGPADWENARTVGDLTNPLGMNKAKAQAVTMATGLRGTGGDPPLSPLYDILINDMKIRKVENPNVMLRQTSTALVTLEAIIPPGAKKGDRLDIKVFAPRDSGTSSLEHGYILPSRLSETALLGGRIRSGDTLVSAEGSVIVNSLREGVNSKKMLTEGMILGGGIIAKDRPVGLGIRESDISIQAAKQIGAAVNARFYSYDRGIKRGIATPKNDKYVALMIHPKYKNSVDRFMRVVRFIPLRETTQQRAQRIINLEEELLNPSTAQAAALKLEAIGEITKDSLHKGLASSSPIVRFCSAEALVYLEDKSAIPHLIDAIENHSEFRFRALTAINVLEDFEVVEQLELLLDSESAEVRYGAFEGLKKRGTYSTLSTTLDIGDQLNAYQIRSAGEPLIHFRLQGKPEMVIFGSQAKAIGTVAVVRTGGLTIRDLDQERLKVSLFAAGQDDRNIICSRDLGELSKAIVELGGSYSDLIRIMYELQKSNSLSARLAVDALPKSDRKYIAEKETKSNDWETSVKFDSPADQESEDSEAESPETSDKQGFSFGTLF